MNQILLGLDEEEEKTNFKQKKHKKFKKNREIPDKDVDIDAWQEKLRREKNQKKRQRRFVETEFKMNQANEVPDNI